MISRKLMRLKGPPDPVISNASSAFARSLPGQFVAQPRAMLATVPQVSLWHFRDVGSSRGDIRIATANGHGPVAVYECASKNG